MAVPTSVSDLDPIIANNSPSGSDAIGTTLDDYLRAHAGIIRQVSDAKISSGVITSSGLTVSAADRILGRVSSGSGAVEEIACTSAGRAILDDADASAQRTTLGLGTAAIANTGTAAGNVVVLDGSAKLPAVDGSQLTGVRSLYAGTAQATTGTGTIDFTGIPSWVKRVTVMFSGVSTNATGIIVVQLGTSGGVVSSGYAGGALQGFGTTSIGVYSNTTGFVAGTGGSASATINGAVRLEMLSANVWAASGTTIDQSTLRSCSTGGSVSLSGTLDRIRITTSDTFDAGSVNILYE